MLGDLRRNIEWVRCSEEGKECKEWQIQNMSQRQSYAIMFGYDDTVKEIFRFIHALKRKEQRTVFGGA